MTAVFPWRAQPQASTPLGKTAGAQAKPSTRELGHRQYAWRNRRAPTESEARNWQLIRSRKLGLWFRRQVPLGGQYIADFLAPTARFVIEVDGASHAGREHADARRDRRLEQLGYRVLRLPAELVLRAPATALARVVEALQA